MVLQRLWSNPSTQRLHPPWCWDAAWTHEYIPLMEGFRHQLKCGRRLWWNCGVKGQVRSEFDQPVGCGPEFRVQDVEYLGQTFVSGQLIRQSDITWPWIIGSLSSVTSQCCRVLSVLIGTSRYKTTAWEKVRYRNISLAKRWCESQLPCRGWNVLWSSIIF